MSGVASALTRPVALFREEQNFAWWVYAFLCLWTVVSCVGPPFARDVLQIKAGGMGRVLSMPFVTIIGVGLPTVLYVGVLRMTTVVTPGLVYVWYGWVPTYRQVLDLTHVRAVEVVKFRPIRDHGFWGVRRGRDGERVLTARGDRGVRLTLSDGSWLVIGSQSPDELAKAIDRVVRPAT